MSTILITGASSGIGAACARSLAQRHDLILVARHAGRLDNLVHELPGQHRVVVADLATTDGLACAAAAALQGIDALVNNAGIFTLADCARIDAAHLEELWRINVTAPMLLTAACLPHLRAGGSIVNISSIAVETPFAGCAAYTASKCALEGWSRVLREELRPHRIRVSVVAPGATDTAVWPASFANADRSQMIKPSCVADVVRHAIEAEPGMSMDRITLAPPGGAV
jgi:short-subunit dehydrogenase